MRYRADGRRSGGSSKIRRIARQTLASLTTCSRCLFHQTGVQLMEFCRKYSQPLPLKETWDHRVPWSTRCFSTSKKFKRCKTLTIPYLMIWSTTREEWARHLPLRKTRDTTATDRRESLSMSHPLVSWCLSKASTPKSRIERMPTTKTNKARPLSIRLQGALYQLLAKAWIKAGAWQVHGIHQCSSNPLKLAISSRYPRQAHICKAQWAILPLLRQYHPSPYRKMPLKRKKRILTWTLLKS